MISTPLIDSHDCRVALFIGRNQGGRIKEGPGRVELVDRPALPGKSGAV
jgi:hypothetical protein